MKKHILRYGMLVIALATVFAVASCRGREQPLPPAPVQQPVQQPIQQPVQQQPGQQPVQQPPVKQPASGGPTPTPPPASKPDLMISEGTVTATGVQNQVAIHILARNQGGGPITAAFTIRWHPHQKDLTQVGCSQDFYNVGMTQWVVDCTYTYPLNLSGEMHWVAAVDAENDVKNESNENNNQKTGTITIVKAGGPAGGPVGGGGAPPAPTNCTWKQVDTRTIQIGWQFSGQTNGFKLYQGKTSLETRLDANARSWSIQDLPPGVQHHFDVRAYNAAGASPTDACAVDVTRR